MDGEALVLLTSLALIGVVGCRESPTCGRGSDNNMHQKQGKTHHKHSISGMRAKQGRCKRIYLDPPCVSGLLVASFVVSTAWNQLVLARAPVVGENVGDAADADALDLTSLRTRPISQ